MLVNEITGTIGEVYRSNRRGFSVFIIDTPIAEVLRDKDAQVRCRYVATRLIEGLPVKITGHWSGGIFEVSHLERHKDKCKLVDYLVTACSGVGEKNAQRIVDKVYDLIFAAKESEISEAIKKEVHGLRKDAIAEAAKLLKAEDADYIDVMEDLLTFGFRPNAINSLYAEYGALTLQRLIDNPYEICHQHGVDFSTADRVAFSKSNVKDKDDIRVRALIRNALSRAASNGHTYLTFRQLTDMVNEISLQSQYECAYTKLRIYTVIKDDKKNLIIDGDHVYLKSMYNDEVTVAKFAYAIAHGHPITNHCDESILPEIEKELGIHYNKEQKIALLGMVNDPGIKIVTGGPGTGKTTIMNGALRLFRKFNPYATIVLCSPTGRAARRLSEATEMDAETIHKTINFMPYGGNEEMNIPMRDIDNPLDADIIIVDESSMVPLSLMAKLIQAIRPSTMLVLCGDAEQLPSVEAGNVFRDFINSGLFPVYVLKENLRQSGNKALTVNCRKIIDGSMPEDLPSFKLKQTHSATESFEYIVDYMAQKYDITKPFATQILAPVRKGISGISALNKEMQKMFTTSEGRSRFNKGDKVMFERTEYQEGYTNGDMGIVTAISASSVTVTRDYDGETQEFGNGATADMELAYAVTIHKSQGSEFESVLIYLPQKPTGMLDRNLLYTAVTRAKKEVLLVYEEDALERALELKSSDERNSGLIERLKTEFNKDMIMEGCAV